jgi:hypothetical protein
MISDDVATYLFAFKEGRNSSVHQPMFLHDLLDQMQPVVIEAAPGSFWVITIPSAGKEGALTSNICTALFDSDVDTTKRLEWTTTPPAPPNMVECPVSDAVVCLTLWTRAAFMSSHHGRTLPTTPSKEGGHILKGVLQLRMGKHDCVFPLRESFHRKLLADVFGGHNSSTRSFKFKLDHLVEYIRDAMQTPPLGVQQPPSTQLGLKRQFQE